MGKKTIGVDPYKVFGLQKNAFSNKTLKEYILSKNMKDIEIQQNTNSSPMTEDEFWVMLHLLINPKLSKKILKYLLFKDKVYLLHVKFGKKILSIYFYWYYDKQIFSTCNFNEFCWWPKDTVFLFLSEIVD